MFFGDSSLISMRNVPPKETSASQFNHSRLMILDESIATPVVVVNLPSPRALLESSFYTIYKDKIYWIRGIVPNLKPVSLFFNNLIVNDDLIYATFPFDAIHLMTSLLFLDSARFISIPQRIYDLYRPNGKESQYPGLEAGLFYIWNNNIDGVQDRLSYLCDCIKPEGVKDTLFKPNVNKFRMMVEYKVLTLTKRLKEENVVMGSYCLLSDISNKDDIRKHHIQYIEGKLSLFAWSVISTMLNTEARTALISTSVLDISYRGQKQHGTPLSSRMSSGANTQKKRRLPVIKGTASITSFFKSK
ncbi:RNase H2 complex component family protein [Babesia bovis T2Bo]|uniref:Uncharacterized protein n=1 Tax=Babesia bovis TaxID=5865 RepID=A7AML2_BABBO|nr:RNase H2 complex component family protein [Babesia bovis T2Bo]EDO07796.1 RNase H2 complex component family protein [Babesia bovis T2Bo]|eukprot:XP_001611364.1 hypothetical protein [Babesia bovis T2Bo]